MTRKIMILIFLIFALFLAFLILRQKYKIVGVKGKLILAETALDSRKQAKGLGERKSLCKKCGMLFIFGEKKEYFFWMKGMEFDLDIIWINGNRIVHIERDVAYNNLDKYYSPFPSDKVLEVNSGFSDGVGLKVGDQIKIY